MFEAVRRAMLVSMGAAAISWDKMKDAVDDLVNKGDLTADEGKKLYTELVDKAEVQGRDLDERIRAQIRQTLTNVGIADRSQISILEGRLEALESRINMLEGQLGLLQQSSTMASGPA